MSEIPTPPSLPQQQPTLQYATPAPPVQYASFGERFLAWLVDVIVLSGIRFAAVLIPAEAFALEKAELANDSVKTIGALVLLIVLFACGWLYYALSETSKYQATLGKRAMNLIVADIEDGPATFVQASARFLLRFVSALLLGVGYLLILFTGKRQALHDIGANCVVIRGAPSVVSHAST